MLSAADAGGPFDPVALEVTDRAQRVQSDLTAARRRLHIPANRATPVDLSAADTAVHQLSQLLDAPLPVRLLVSGTGESVVLDLETNRVLPRPDVPAIAGGLVRDGQLVIDILPQVLAIPLDGGAARPIATTYGLVLPGPRPDQMWIGDGPHLKLIDLTGRVRRQVSVPDVVAGAVRSGLILGTGRLSVWDPIGHRTVRRLPHRASLVGTGTDEVALSDCSKDPGPTSVHLIDVSTGRDRVVEMPAGEYRVSDATVAPDSKHVAIVGYRSDGDRRLFIADLRSGTLTKVKTAGVSSVARGLVWTPDSRRLFFAAGSAFDTPSASLWTYALQRSRGHCDPLPPYRAGHAAGRPAGQLTMAIARRWRSDRPR